MADLSLFTKNPTFRRNFLSICIAAANGKVLRDLPNVFYGNLSLQGMQKIKHKLSKQQKIINGRRSGMTFVGLDKLNNEAEGMK